MLLLAQQDAGDPMPWGMALFMGLLMIGVGAALGWVASRAAGGGIARNPLAGIRIPSTMRSDAAWVAGHRAARPWLYGAGGAAALSGAVCLFRPSNALGMTSVLIGCGLMVGLVAVGAFAADQAARDA